MWDLSSWHVIDTSWIYYACSIDTANYAYLKGEIIGKLTFWMRLVEEPISDRKIRSSTRSIGESLDTTYDFLKLSKAQSLVGILHYRVNEKL